MASGDDAPALLIVMAAKQLFVDPSCIEQNVARLHGDDRHHLINVLRLGPSSRIILVDGTGLRHEGIIETVTAATVVVQIKHTSSMPKPSGPKLILIPGLAKGSKPDWVLRRATELGVDEISFAVCQRSIVRPKDGQNKRRRWQEIVRQASRQSQRSHLPRVNPPRPLRELLKTDESDCRLIAVPGGRLLADVDAVLRTAQSSVTLVVGPEGGLTAEETELAYAHGFCGVSLGPLVLRTETAAIALLTIGSYLTGRLATGVDP